jgi:hypothetical protein
MEMSATPAPSVTDAGASRHHLFVRGLGVLAGWYATVLVAFALWFPTLSDAPSVDQDCAGFGCGLSPRESAVVGLYLLGAFILPVSIAGSLATLGLTLLKPVRSGVVAGTLAAAVGLIGVPAVAAVVL